MAIIRKPRQIDSSAAIGQAIKIIVGQKEIDRKELVLKLTRMGFLMRDIDTQIEALKGKKELEEITLSKGN